MSDTMKDSALVGELLPKEEFLDQRRKQVFDVVTNYMLDSIGEGVTYVSACDRLGIKPSEFNGIIRRPEYEEKYRQVLETISCRHMESYHKLAKEMENIGRNVTGPQVAAKKAAMDAHLKMSEKFWPKMMGRSVMVTTRNDHDELPTEVDIDKAIIRLLKKQ